MQLTWTDRKGWHSLSTSSVEYAWGRLSRFYCPATLRDADGEVIGGVEELRDGQRRWLRWMDSDAAKREVRA